MTVSSPHYVFNRPPLAPTAYARMPLGSVMPLGWLERRLRVQADG